VFACECVRVNVSVCLCIAVFDESTVVSLSSVTVYLVSVSTTGSLLFHTNMERASKPDCNSSKPACAVTADMTTYESQNPQISKG
jgi:hypothetical protein